LSRYKCTVELYKAFIQATSVRYTVLSLSEVSPIQLSHDSISRWLHNRNFRPSQIYNITEKLIDKHEKSILIVDDSILSKVHSKKIALVNYQYSGNAHDVIAGIGLVNFVWHGLETKQTVPIDYRIYDKASDGKTKNTHCQDMVKLAKSRSLTPEAIVADAWYSSLNNLKVIRDLGYDWVIGLRKNRKVNKNETLENIEIPDEGLKIHLRGYGWIWIFKFVAKNGRIDYIATNKDQPTREYIEEIFKARWSIEVYHRELKQSCGIERCQSRTGRAQRNHICLAIMAWIDLHKQRFKNQVTIYQQKWEVIKYGITDAIAAKLKFT